MSSEQRGRGDLRRPRRRSQGDPDYPMRARLLGCELRLRRQDLGLTISGLAGKAGLSPSFLSEIEQGKKLPSLVSLDRIAGALGIPRNSLIPPPGAGLDAPDLPARIRRARERMDLTQEQLAAMASLSAGMISQIEAGAARPSLETVDRLARALSVTPCHLLVEGPDPETLLANLTPETRRMLLDPDVQAVLQAAAGLDGKGFRAVMEVIRESRRGMPAQDQPPPGGRC